MVQLSKLIFGNFSRLFQVGGSWLKTLKSGGPRRSWKMKPKQC